jgi:hypothetical protein
MPGDFFCPGEIMGVRFSVQRRAHAANAISRNVTSQAQSRRDFPAFLIRGRHEEKSKNNQTRT